VSRAPRRPSDPPAAAPRTAASPAAEGGVLHRAISRLRGAEHAPAPRTGAAPAAEDAPAERPVMALRDAPAPTALSRAPMPAPAALGTSGQTLARAIGAEVGYDDAGASEIVFPAPGGAPPFVPFSTAPRSVSREVAEAAPPAMAEASAPARAREPAAAPAPEAAAAAPELDKDELYEEFLSRLRRDILHEREQSGLLIDEIP
jgi:hypothetical protein